MCCVSSQVRGTLFSRRALDACTGAPRLLRCPSLLTCIMIIIIIIIITAIVAIFLCVVPVVRRRDGYAASRRERRHARTPCLYDCRVCAARNVFVHLRVYEKKIHVIVGGCLAKWPVCVCMCQNMCLYIRKCLCMIFVREIHIQTQAHVCMCVCIYIYIYVYIYIYRHTHTHTHTDRYLEGYMFSVSQCPCSSYIHTQAQV